MINDSVASDIVQAVKGMSRRFRLKSQHSRNGSVVLEFTSPELSRQTRETIKKEVIAALSRKGINYNEFGFRKGDTYGDIFIDADDRLLEISLRGNKIRDSKLYKIDNKIVKASSVSDAIKKMKDSIKDNNNYTYRGYEIIDGGYGWIVYSGGKAISKEFVKPEEAEKWIDNGCKGPMRR